MTLVAKCLSSAVSLCLFVCLFVCMYVCMYISHTLISVGSLVAHAYRHDVHVGRVDTHESKHYVKGP